MKAAPRNADGTTLLPTHNWSWRRPLWPVYASILAQSDRPIYVGPWRGEIGFEALYWIPFIDQFIKDYKIDPSRIVPISRGGASVWYGVPQGMELYAMRTPQQLRVQAREEVAKTGMFKQVAMSRFDRDILKDVGQTLKHHHYHVLHPAWMYHTLAPFWTGQTGVDWLAHRVMFRTLAAQAIPVELPAEFVAVRFYSRQTFPGNHKMTRGFVQAALEQMTAEHDVVLLDHGLYLDDHADLTRGIKGPRIHHLSDLTAITPETNLAIQGAVLSRALGFVGTYGGFAQLALRMGKPSVSVFVDWGNATSFAHRALADVLSLKMGIPAVVLRLAELPMLQSVLPLMSVQTPQRSPLQLPA